MKPQITVIISTWQVPFDQVVREIKRFRSPKSALAFINAASKKWWEENDGERGASDPYEPVAELGYNHAHYELWGGECGFHAMIDADSYARLHEDHYRREYDEKGVTRPGYLINAYVAGAHPGGLTADQKETYRIIQEEGLAALGIHKDD